MSTDGVIYEPRSLWSIAYVQSAPTAPTRFRLDKRHFYNGERWPIQINRIALAAINYVFATIPGDDQIAESASVINRIRFMISVGQRYYFNSKNFISAGALAPRPTWMPQPMLLPGDATILRSSLWGQCNLTFDKPLEIPRTGTIEWGLSMHTPWFDDEDDDVESEALAAWLLYQESGGNLWPGSARARQVALHPYTGPTVPSIESWPYPPDQFGTGAPPAGIGRPNWWAPEGNFPAAGRGGQIAGLGASFAEQESTRSGSTVITEMRTYIDQLNYDAEVDDDFIDDVPTSPLSLRTGCRVRSANAGSKTWWWRPGAPLALVFDTITPACVYKLPEPITLRPGEQLDVEMEFPPSITIGEVTQETEYHMGISFNGFAAIEG
jgi:hypothetical protein